MKRVDGREGRQKKKSQNKNFAIISAFPAIITNLIFRDPLLYSYEELVRYFRNGFPPQVLGYFFENFIVWLAITLAGFFIPFLLLKGLSLAMEEGARELEKKTKISKAIAGDFSATKKVDNKIGFDHERKKWATYDNLGLVSAVYSYDNIINFELMEDNKSIAGGGIGRAIVGGALFGGVGAIVGGVTGRRITDTCNSLKLKITLNDMAIPAVYVDFINSATKKDSPTYKAAFAAAQECLSTFQLICSKREGKGGEIAEPSPASEVRQYKALLDEGIITQEEFNRKKKELLGL